MDGGSGGDGESARPSRQLGLLFLPYRVCDYSPINILIRLSQSVYLPLFSHFRRSLSPLDPLICFLLTGSVSLMLAV